MLRRPAHQEQDDAALRPRLAAGRAGHGMTRRRSRLFTSEQVGERKAKRAQSADSQHFAPRQPIAKPGPTSQDVPHRTARRAAWLLLTWSPYSLTRLLRERAGVRAAFEALWSLQRRPLTLPSPHLKQMGRGF